MPNFNWPIIGHSPIIRYLQTVIRNNSLGHAYLFYGPDGLGKSLIADYFIKSIYCRADIIPCNNCAYCRQVANKVHPDIIFIQRDEDKKNITIEQVRQARTKIHHGTFLNSHKIILIREAHTLSLAASNALLKILEEPTQKTIFILLSPSIKNIPATILSRIQTIKFMPLGYKELQKYLITIGLGREQSYELSHLSGGYPGKILPLLDHPKLLKEHKNKLRELLSHISGDLNTRFALVEKLAGQAKSERSKLEVGDFLFHLSLFIRDALLIKNSCFDKIIHISLKQELAKFAHNYSSNELAGLLDKIKLTQNYINHNVNMRLALENLMLAFQSPKAMDSVSPVSYV